jgi:hypothetical protein
MGCDRTLWRYPQFEASFLSFVEELDLAPLVRSEDEVQKRAELDQMIAALEGQRLTLERRRDLTFELLDGSTGTTVKFVSGKLEEMAKALAGVESQLAAKRAERETFQAEVARFYEGRDQIKGLIARLRDTGDAEVYKLRALIAARLKSLVSKLVVAPAGGAPLNQRTVSDLEAHLSSLEDRDETLDGVLEQLRGDVESERSTRRYLQVLFKDGTHRTIYPDDRDPLTAVEQLYKSAKGLHRIGSDGEGEIVFLSPEEKAGVQRLIDLAEELPDDGSLIN